MRPKLKWALISVVGIAAGYFTVVSLSAIGLISAPSWVWGVSSECSGSDRFLENTHTSARVDYKPNDPMLDEQRALGDSSFPEAWPLARGDDVRVAIVDSGIDADHPDLASKIVAQKDFVNGDSTAEDITGHGTHVAGTIAAATNNGKGIAGGCPGCRLLVAKALSLSGGDASTVADAIRWSADQGADVINVSFSGPDTEILDNAVSYANDKGIVVVAAAPNLSDHQDAGEQTYPAAYDSVLAVVAADRIDQDATSASYGNWVGIAAPGANVISTFLDGQYWRTSGTSEAVPQVAALAALLAGEGHSSAEIRHRIKATATDIGDPGFDELYGCGKINAYQAVLLESS